MYSKILVTLDAMRYHLPKALKASRFRRNKNKQNVVS
jgi:hypothetical protein